MKTFSDISEVYRFLERLPSFQVHGSKAFRPGLDRIYAFCNYMGHPEREISCIHVAGTNGKGSVSAILALMFETAGYRCGLFSSPHMENIRERFRINQQMIPEKELLRFFRLYGQALTSADLSYFEITTAIAFWWFADQKVDIAILETGLGGRMDATNIIDPEVSVITSIAHDHQNFLGKSLAEIAREKGGIIKRGRPLVIGNMPAVARAKLQKIAESLETPVWDARSLRPGNDPVRSLTHHKKKSPLAYTESMDHDNIPGAIATQKFRLRDKGKVIEIHAHGLTPVYRWNIAIAYLVSRVLSDRFPIAEQALYYAVQNITKSGLLPGRFEQLVPGLPWYFDGAHNPEAARALAETIRTQDWDDDPVIILSLMKDKVQKKMFEPFSVFKKNYYYTLHTERAANAALITPFLSNLKDLPSSEEEIIDFFTGLTKQVVIFTGSFYFYGVVKRWISRIIKAG